jgi:hypothetical protein
MIISSIESVLSGFQLASAMFRSPESKQVAETASGGPTTD